MGAQKTALVVGANSKIGSACLEALIALNYDITCTYRRDKPNKFDNQNEKLNLSNINEAESSVWMKSFDVAILIPSLTLSTKFIPLAQKFGVKKYIFLSSYNTYRFGHTEHYAKFLSLESDILNNGTQSIILQPTAILGHPHASLCKILFKKANNTKPILLAKRGQYKYQPIDYRDVASAVIHAATSEKISPGRYPIAGTEIVTQSNLYQTLTEVMEQSAKFYYIPSFAIPVIRIVGKVMYNLHPYGEFLSRFGQDRHCVHEMLPQWKPHFSFRDMCNNITNEFSRKSQPNAQRRNT